MQRGKPTAADDAAYCLAQVRRFDHDRYLTALFASAVARDDLLALYAFNLEVAKTREQVREPTMGLMRLQWWRECIAEIYAGGGRRHQVVHPLAAAIQQHALPRLHFDRLIEAREADLSDVPPADLSALLEYVEATSAGLGLLALGVLGGSGHEVASTAVRSVSIAWGLTGLLRAVPIHAQQRRIHLPQTILSEHGIAIDDLRNLKRPPALAAVARRIAEEARRHLDAGSVAARGTPRSLLPALLTGTLARLHLRRLAAARYDLWSLRVQQPSGGAAWRLLAAYLRGRF